MGLDSMFEGASKIFKSANELATKKSKELLRKLTDEQLIDRYVILSSDDETHPDVMKMIQDEMKRRRLKY